MSMGTLLLTPQLRNGPKRGLAFQPARAIQSPPPCSPIIAVPSPLPISGLLTLQHGCPSLWPLRSCHLGYAIPVEVGDRSPPPGPYIPNRGTPSFYSKALTVIWGLAPASPSLWLPKGPVLTEPQATDRGQGRGDHVARGQGTLTPAPSCICNA